MDDNELLNFAEFLKNQYSSDRSKTIGSSLVFPEKKESPKEKKVPKKNIKTVIVYEQESEDDSVDFHESSESESSDEEIVRKKPTKGSGIKTIEIPKPAPAKPVPAPTPANSPANSPPKPVIIRGIPWDKMSKPAIIKYIREQNLKGQLPAYTRMKKNELVEMMKKFDNGEYEGYEKYGKNLEKARPKI